MMDFLVENWGALIAGLIAIATAFKLTSVSKYIKFAKEVGDIYVTYQLARKNGKFSDDEKKKIGAEVIEAAESGKVTFGKKKE